MVVIMEFLHYFAQSKDKAKTDSHETEVQKCFTKTLCFIHVQKKRIAECHLMYEIT
jgi:hypothetical protein